MSLATRTDCSFCRPSEPLWPQTLVHLILGGSWDELGRRVKRQGRRTVVDNSSLMVWWVTFRIFTTASALVTPDERRGEEKKGEENQCHLVNEATGSYFSLRWKKGKLIASCRRKFAVLLGSFVPSDCSGCGVKGKEQSSIVSLWLLVIDPTGHYCTTWTVEGQTVEGRYQKSFHKSFIKPGYALWDRYKPPLCSLKHHSQRDKNITFIKTTDNRMKGHKT